jgi:hypothetical protein
MAAKKGHERGTAHEFTPEEARIAGRKGGLARAMNRSKAGNGDGSAENNSNSGFPNPAEAGGVNADAPSVNNG